MRTDLGLRSRQLSQASLAAITRDGKRVFPGALATVLKNLNALELALCVHVPRYTRAYYARPCRITFLSEFPSTGHGSASPARCLTQSTMVAVVVLVT